MYDPQQPRDANQQALGCIHRSQNAGHRQEGVAAVCQAGGAAGTDSCLLPSCGVWEAEERARAPVWSPAGGWSSGSLGESKISLPPTNSLRPPQLGARV